MFLFPFIIKRTEQKMHLIDVLLKTLALWAISVWAFIVSFCGCKAVTSKVITTISEKCCQWPHYNSPNFCHQVWMDIDLSEWVQQKQKWDAWNSSLEHDAGFKRIHKMSRVPLAKSLGEALTLPLCRMHYEQLEPRGEFPVMEVQLQNQHFQKVSWDLNCEFMITHLNGSSWGMWDLKRHLCVHILSYL